MQKNTPQQVTRRKISNLVSKTILELFPKYSTTQEILKFQD